MSVLIEAAGIVKGYGDRPVLSLERLDVRRGETLCVMGPNGAGKSTLVRLLNLVEAADRGTIRFDGRRVTHRSLWARRRMAGVFQQPHMFNGSVFDNVAYGLRLRRLRRNEMATRAGLALEMMEMTALAGRDARSLSQGEKQKVALARVLALEPELLFLDEPAASLDPQAGSRFNLILRRVMARLDTTVVYVTHSFTEALNTGDRLALMMEGSILQEGPARQVFRKPVDARAARFLGFENILPARVTGQAAGAVVELAGSGRVFTRSQLDGDVTLCVRAEEVTLHSGFEDGGISPTVNRFAARIVLLEAEGAVCRVVLDCGFPLVARVAMPQVRHLGLAPGMDVEARFDEEAAHLLPGTSAGGSVDVQMRQQDAITPELASCAEDLQAATSAGDEIADG
jgi:tungstate transport system ATP-binding protein